MEARGWKERLTAARQDLMEARGWKMRLAAAKQDLNGSARLEGAIGGWEGLYGRCDWSRA